MWSLQCILADCNILLRKFLITNYCLKIFVLIVNNKAVYFADFLILKVDTRIKIKL